MSAKQGIIIEAFGYTCIEGPEWNYAAIQVVGFYGGLSFPLSADENKMIEIALEEIEPIKDERWHKVWLNRVMVTGSVSEPFEEYYEFEKIKLLK